MFDNLSDRLSSSFSAIRGRNKLSEDNVRETLREVRKALLEADVALPVVKSFVDDVRSRAIGAEVSSSLTPGQAFIKIVNDELVKVMGGANESLNLRAQPPAVVLMAGLQGAGKTTSTAKLARFLKEREKKKVMVVSADVYRPAAIKQLETLAEQVGVEFFPSDINQKPEAIAAAAIQSARLNAMDVLLVDTAGRLAIDETLMAEIKALHAFLNPVETLFVVDSMTGQDAANTAKAFNEALPLTGVILTKTDGDARGGAALSIRTITGKPIKFLGVGEKTDALEPFHPERVASRILGMGDMLSLIEEVERKVDKTKAEKLARKVVKGKGKDFDLLDYRDQLEQMMNLGGMSALMDKLPGMGNLPDHIKGRADDKDVGRQIAIINSMTPQERTYPALVKGSRKRRIASGSGTQLADINKVMKQHAMMQKMMKRMTKGGMAKMMAGLGGGGMPGMPPGGGLPPGLGGGGGLGGGMPGLPPGKSPFK